MADFTQTDCSPPRTNSNKSLITTCSPHPESMVVSYKECLKNHAATLGGHALDGCGEFMPSPTASPSDPTSLKCAACGCHRNFHRRDPFDPAFVSTPLLHLPPPRPPPPHHSSSTSPGLPSSPSPPQSVSSPIPYSYYSAPHMLLALSSRLPAAPSDEHAHHHQSGFDPTVASKKGNSNGRKRSRTKFSPEQKVKMREFAEKLGWKMQRCDERSVEEFCSEVGVSRGVLKVWMHNNKYTIGKREVGSLNLHNNFHNNSVSDNVSSRIRFNDHDNYHINNGSSNEESDNHNESGLHLHVSTNGSSSS